MSLGELFHQLSVLVGLPAVLLAAIAASGIVIVRDWRLALFGYALLSAMLALLLSQIIPTEWALLQAIIGGLNAVMFYLSARQLRWHPLSGVSWEERWPQMASVSSFRALAVALTAVAFWALRESIVLPQVDPPIPDLFGDLIFWLALVGLLGLALHEEPLHAGLSLLTLIGGCQLILYALIQRRMIIGLLDAGQLLLGLAISYLMVSQGLASAQRSAAEGGPLRGDER